MAATSLLARLGLRTSTLGSAASLVYAAPQSEGYDGQDSHTYANRTGWYHPSATSIAFVTEGLERVRFYADGGVQIGGSFGVSPGAGVLLTQASSASRAGLRLPHGNDPSAPVNGDLWTTTSGLFARINGATASFIAPTITSLADNDILQYSAGSSRWENRTRADAGIKTFHGVESRVSVVPLPTNLTTTTFSLSTDVTPLTYWRLGVRTVVNTVKSCTISASAGLKHIYFVDDAGTIQSFDTFQGLSGPYTYLATVKWNGTNYGLVNDERHNYDRDIKWHIWAHNTVGTRYRAGLTLSHNSGTGNAATFSLTSGEIDDEDIQFTISASSAFPTPNAGRLIFQTGASTYGFVNVTATTPGYLGPNQRPYVVNSTGYGLVELPSAPNRYVNVFVYATTDVHTPLYFVTETVSAATVAAGGYTSTANARAVPFPNFSNSDVTVELRPLYRLVWRADGQLQALTAADDYRTVSSLPQGAGTDTVTASMVSFAPAGTITAVTVQTALEQLDSLKVAKAGDTMTGALIVAAAGGVTALQAATQDAVALAGRAGGTSSFVATISPTTLTGNRTATLPDASITVAGVNLAQTFTASQTLERSTTSGVGWATRVTADTVDRWRVRADGQQDWGTGSAATDVTLYRTGVGALTCTGTFTASSTSTSALRSGGGVEAGQAGSFVTNAYYSGSWLYRGNNYATAVVDNGSVGLEFRSAVSGVADAAITWVAGLRVAPTVVAALLPVTCSSSVTATGIVRSTTGFFEGPANGGLAVNAYYSGSWKYRSDGYAVSVVEAGANGLQLQAAVSGVADAALTWVTGLRVTTAAVTALLPFTCSSTFSATSLTATGLVSGRLPIISTGGLLVDSAEWTRASAGGGSYISHQPTATGTGTAYGTYTLLISNPSANNTGTVQGAYMEAQSTAANAFNYTSTTWGIIGFIGAAQHYGSGTAASVIGGGFGPVSRPGSGVINFMAGVKTLLQNLHTTQAVVEGNGIYIAPPSSSGGGYTTYKALNIAATSQGTSSCIGIDIGALTGANAFAIRTSTGRVSIGDSTAATNTTSGALTVTGGLGVGGAGFFGAAVSISSAVTGQSFGWAYTTNDATSKIVLSMSRGSGVTPAYMNALSTGANDISALRFDVGGTVGLTIASGTVTVPDGAVATPGLRLTTEASGLYRISATSLGFSVAGTAAASLTSTGVMSANQFVASTGSLPVTVSSNNISYARAAAPSYLDQVGVGGSIVVRTSTVGASDTTVITFGTTNITAALPLICSSTLSAVGGLTLSGIGYGATNNLVLDAVTGTAQARLMRDLSTSANGGSFDIGVNVYYSGSFQKDVAGTSGGYLAFVPSIVAGETTRFSYYGVASDSTTVTERFRIHGDGRGQFFTQLIVADGNAATPGIRTTTEAHGLYRVSATTLGVSVAGVLAATIGGPGGTFGSFVIWNTPSAAEYSSFSNSRTDSYMALSGGTGPANSGNVRLYGSTHATKADRIEFLRANTISAFFDGSGVLTLNGALNDAITQVAVDTSLGSTHYTVLVDATSGPITITLPDSTATTNINGRVYNIKKIDASANAVTVQRAGASDLIDGATTCVVTAQYQTRTVQCRTASAAANRWNII